MKEEIRNTKWYSILREINRARKRAIINYKVRKEERSYAYWMVGDRQIKRQRRYISKLKKKERINILFFASSLSQWHYQGIYEKMSHNSRYNCTIIINPIKSLPTEIKEAEREKLIVYFTQNGTPFVDYLALSGKERNIRKRLEPDILFYTQPYSHMYDDNADATYFTDRLTCFAEYGLATERLDSFVDLPTLNLAWKYFVSTEFSRANASKVMENHGRNIETVGYANADGYLSPNHKDVWKRQATAKKRIIWAPHFSIADGRCVTRNSNFLEMADYMCRIATEYKDRLQFAFKPHPKLMSELMAHPDWGVDKAKKYYEWWEKGENTQLETGDFIDLFMTSDAMIHDCASFRAEYLYTNKPVIYTTSHLQDVKNVQTEFGQKCLDLHYLGTTENEIKSFIENIVLNGKDSLKNARESFVRENLLPPHGSSVAENIYESICKSLSIQQ